jgi:large subunit ribosomal protein L37Ae
MAKKVKKLSTKRFGTRYGRRLKEKVAEIESNYRKRNKCPYCGKTNVKRIALGIWNCRSCKTKFTGRAYSILKKKLVQEEEPSKKEKVTKVEEKITKSEEESKEKEVKEDGKV